MKIENKLLISYSPKYVYKLYSMSWNKGYWSRTKDSDAYIYINIAYPEYYGELFKRLIWETCDII